MAVRLSASIFASRMGFSPSLVGVITAASIGLLVGLGAPVASAEAIPGPPLPVAGSHWVGGAFCPPRAGAIGNLTGFAAAAIAALAVRRRAPRD